MSSIACRSWAPGPRTLNRQSATNSSNISSTSPSMVRTCLKSVAGCGAKINHQPDAAARPKPITFENVKQDDMSPAEHVILCVNSGSSSLKFALYCLAELEETRIAQGAVEGIGLPAGQLWMRDKANDVGFPRPAAAGHRVVHGGPHHSAAERVNASLLRELRELIPFAPLHLPSAIQGIDAVAARFPGLAQVACFDTAFHRRMPEVAQRLPLSHDLWDEGVRRYGFHGLSYEYIVSTLGDRAQGRIVI